MAEIAAGFVGPAIDVVKWVGTPILRQFKYLWYFTTNIANLEKEAKKLQDKEQDLQRKVQAGEDNGGVISREVESWLRDSKGIIDEKDGIINEVPNVKGGCLKLRARFSLSKRAKKTADRLKELQDQHCKFNDNAICHPGSPPAREKILSEGLYEFESRKKIEEGIMATLRDGDVKMIGICGMGGLGKTTMAKNIRNRALGEHVFDEVAMAVVSQPIDKLKIQDEIGGSLGLKLQGECWEARVQKLHARLSGTKRILLVLDDVWKRFHPEDLGIPRGCTILLTSRNEDVLTAMNVEKIFGMEVLSKEDSWLLFRMEAGQCVDTRLNSIAKEVVSECAGLPIALITVGAALKGEEHVYIWENALQRLKINCPPDIPEYIAEVYNPLKLSYDVLERKYQDVFLLCCLYPEDADIPLERLTYFCMGLRLLEGAIGNVEAARNRIRALSKVLKSRSLLLDSEKGDEYVRMHDVVRDVCIFIAKQKGYIGDNDLTSSLQRYKLHSGFMLLQAHNSTDDEIKFDWISDLYVLSIERCSQLKSLPFTQRPNNLIILVVDSCRRLKTLSVVGELVNLEILICRNCGSIEELPPEIKGLNRLKVLELTGCENLQRIGRGIISSLVGLEELKMLGSFNKWEGKGAGEERENAGLRELEVLTNLRCLEIEIEDLALAKESRRLSSEIDRCTITFLYKMIIFYHFDSRKSIEEEIMTTLRGEDVKMMGICGMGGLGKTTMAKTIMNRALNEHVFEEVVMTVVSRPIDKLKIQLEIGGSLGLKLEGESSQARVQKLHARLSGPKRILLVLDDVWERFQPEDLGIPCDYKGCTILVTSRNRDVLSAMNVEKIFGMEVLSEEDSWLLFKEKVSTHAGDTKLNSIAKDIVTECAGLPIVLITVGAALKGEVDVSIWKDALRQLKQCNPDIPDFIANVYNPLKLSYDFLGSKHKYVFLLCCLYPEDADIPLEELTYFCVGLRIFEEGIGNVEEARNRMRALTKVLKSRSLLLDSEKGDDHVRMHDVVRDVCIFIAKQEGYIGDNDCSWLSSSHRSELPMGLAFPNLRLLFFRAHEYWRGKFTLENSFLEGIRDLSVICIERYSLVSLSHTTQMLRNLNALLLHSCRRVETLSVVGELVNLEILICCDCDSIEELPLEIKGLNRLKVLELTGCENLQRIGRGIISSLVGLEELKMLRSFNKWEAEDREEKENAGLKEVETLSKLRSLEIEIEDLALATENIRLSSKVDRFTIRFKCERSLLQSSFDKYLTEQKMYLNWFGATCLGHWIEMLLLKETEFLSLIGNGANIVDLTKLEKIRCLELGRCESMKNLVTTSMGDGGGATVFPSLDHLILFELPKLEEIWDRRVSLNCFQILKELKLDHLPALKQLWKSNQNDVGKDFLPRLEVLQIWSCVMMEAVFLWKEEDGNENNSRHHISKMFPKLKKLSLFELPNLISFCQGIEGIEFPLLRELDITICVEMKGMVSKENNWGGSSSNASIHGLFSPQQVSFGCLKSLTTEQNPFCSHTIDHVSLFNGLERLTITKCAGSQSLFTSSVVGNLVNLKELWIDGCKEMVEVIKDDEEKGMSCGRQRAPLLFPKLHWICLSGLSKLASFCELKCDVEFPSLRVVVIRECPNMKNFTLGSLAAPNLESFQTDLKDYLLQVPFISLKQLSVSENEKPLNCYQIHGSVFDRLEELSIYEYKGSMSLFSSSITGNLVNLTTLTIWNCYEMVKVIEEKEEEKEKVVSGAQRTTILFPKLHKIHLRLFKLVRFCEWKCDVELPSLTELRIFDCHNMKSFTLGPLNTPNLKSVYIDPQDFGAVKDLHAFLQQQYFNRTEEKKAEEAEKKKGGEEEQERKGETEEEQN